jgi:hypothetical protein
VPVSRKRKKNRKLKAVARANPPMTRSGFDCQPPQRPDVWTGVGATQRHVDERDGLAAAAAEDLVAELIKFAPDRLDRELEDELCARSGVRLQEWAARQPGERVGPYRLAETVITVAAEAVQAALRELSTNPDRWQAAWRILGAVARTVPYPLSADAAEAIKHLRTVTGGQMLPVPPEGPSVTGQVLWTRDAYGSRFGITAAFSTHNEPDRWYLWDVDVCAYKPFTVHSAYYPTPEQALAVWQAAVGEPAAAHTAFTPVDDPGLLTDLLPFEEGALHPGGENADQFAEYHRSMRLAEAARERAVESLSRPEPRAGLDAATATTQFTAWLRENRTGQPQPAELDELITELAASWQISSPAALYATCSPHRVAMTVLHLRDYYLEDFATQLVALLPDWVSWLSARNNTPTEMAERCRPYALGEPHAEISLNGNWPNYLARVTE